MKKRKNKNKEQYLIRQLLWFIFSDRDRALGTLLLFTCALVLVIPPVVKAAQDFDAPYIALLNTDRPTTLIIDTKPAPAPTKARVAHTNPAPAVRASGDAQPSQAQKDSTSVACILSYEAHAAEMTKANISRALYLTTCYNDVLAIAKHESGFNPKAANVSKIEKSYGPFQINLQVHTDITRSQAEDYDFAVAWTINHLHAYGWPVQRTQAIQCHNGCGAENGYAGNVKATAARFKAAGL